MTTSYVIRLPVALLVIVLLATGSGQAQEKLERVNLAIPVPALSQLPSYAGVRFGLFREEGLDVQIVLMNGRLVGPALLQGDLDFATLADTMMRFIPVETPDRVRAGRGAITASDTPVVNDAHQAFFIDISRAYGADLDTGRMLTMHAGPWKEPRFDMEILSLDVGDQFDPMDGAAPCRFVGSNDGNIVFCLTSDHAGLTSGTSIQIDDHPPTMLCHPEPPYTL